MYILSFLLNLYLVLLIFDPVNSPCAKWNISYQENKSTEAPELSAVDYSEDPTTDTPPIQNNHCEEFLGYFPETDKDISLAPYAIEQIA